MTGSHTAALGLSKLFAAILNYWFVAFKQVSSREGTALLVRSSRFSGAQHNRRQLAGAPDEPTNQRTTWLKLRQEGSTSIITKDTRHARKCQQGTPSAAMNPSVHRRAVAFSGVKTQMQVAPLRFRLGAYWSALSIGACDPQIKTAAMVGA